MSKHAISFREDDGFRVRSSSLQCSRMAMPSSSWARIDEQSVTKIIKVYQNQKKQISRIISLIWSVYQYYYLIIISVYQIISVYHKNHQKSSKYIEIKKKNIKKSMLIILIHVWSHSSWAVISGDLWMPRSASNRLRSKRRPWPWREELWLLVWKRSLRSCVITLW